MEMRSEKDFHRIAGPSHCGFDSNASFGDKRLGRGGRGVVRLIFNTSNHQDIDCKC
jgi:hypothetical protein